MQYFDSSSGSSSDLNRFINHSFGTDFLSVCLCFREVWKAKIFLFTWCNSFCAKEFSSYECHSKWHEDSFYIIGGSQGVLSTELCTRGQCYTVLICVLVVVLLKCVVFLSISMNWFCKHTVIIIKVYILGFCQFWWMFICHWGKVAQTSHFSGRHTIWECAETPAKQASTWLPTLEGWKAELSWVVGYVLGTEMV